MSHSRQQSPRCHELFLGGDTGSRVYMEHVLGHSAAKAAKDQGCSSMSAEAFAHARRALDIARKNNRSDLEKKVQLGKAEFLLIMGRRRESLEVEILVAAKAERMEIEQGADGQVVSMGGVSMDEVAMQLGGKICKRDSLKFEIVMAAKAEELAIEEGKDGSIASVGGMLTDEAKRLFMKNEVDEKPSSSFRLNFQHKTGNGGSTAHTGGPHSCAGSRASSDTLWDSSVQFRRVRDVRGHLITVTSPAPELRRKPAFKTS